MTCPLHLSACLQRLHVERLRLAISALALVQGGQVAEAGQGPRITVAESTARQRQGTLGRSKPLGVGSTPKCCDHFSVQGLPPGRGTVFLRQSRSTAEQQKQRK